MPASSQVCCKSHSSNEGGFDACRKASIESTSMTSHATVTCKGTRACMESKWARSGQANLCCSMSNQECAGIDVGNNNAISLFSTDNT